LLKGEAMKKLSIMGITLLFLLCCLVSAHAAERSETEKSTLRQKTLKSDTERKSSPVGVPNITQPSTMTENYMGYALLQEIMRTDSDADGVLDANDECHDTPYYYVRLIKPCDNCSDSKSSGAESRDFDGTTLSKDEYNSERMWIESDAYRGLWNPQMNLYSWINDTKFKVLLLHNSDELTELLVTPIVNVDLSYQFDPMYRGIKGIISASRAGYTKAGVALPLIGCELAVQTSGTHPSVQ